MNCCSINKGLFPHNSPINTGIIAPINGMYTVWLEYAGAKIAKIFTATAAPEPIIINLPFNENYLYNFIVLDTFGVPITELVDGDPCGNFQLTTFVNVTENCPPSDCPDA